MNFQNLKNDVLQRGLVHRGFVVLSLAIMMLAPEVTRASCGDPRGMRLAPGINLSAAIRAGFVNQLADENADNSIVGVWQVTYYLPDKSLFYQALDQWHPDGTEFEIANLNPITGNTCMGVWKRVGSKIRLHHLGWGFDTAGNPTGMFTLDEENTVSEDGNSYQGTFDYTPYDLNGNPDLADEVKGTLSATRVTVH